MNDHPQETLKARSCYGHLGGTLGSRLFERMLELGWLELEEGKATVYQLTETGRQEFTKLGVDFLKKG